MSRGRRVALAVTGVAVAGVVGVAVLARVAGARSDVLLGAVGRSLGREVRAEHVGITVWGGLGVALRRVAIADDPAFGSGEPFVRADAVALRLRLLPLLRRRLVVDRVTLDGPVVRLIRERGGRLNVDSLREHGAAGARDPTSGAAGDHRSAFQIASVRLRRGTIRYEERASGRSLALEDVAVDAQQPAWNAPIPVRARARLVGEGFRLDDVVSDGVLDLSAERPTYRGSVHAGPGALGAIAIDRVKGDVRATPPVVDVDALECETLGGTVTGSAHLSGEQGLTAKIAARGIQLAKVPAPRNRPRPDGTLGLEGAVAGPTGAAFAAQATGQGRFDVADGRIEGAGFGKPILDALQPFIRPGVADRLRERYPDVFADDDLRFTRLSGSGRLAGGRIRSDDLVLAAKSWEARGEGSLGLDGDVDARIQLLASPALTADVLGQSRTRAALVDASGRLSIPLRARGPVRHPEVTPDPAFAATAARALIGKEAGEAAGQLLERLFGERKRGTGR